MKKIKRGIALFLVGFSAGSIPLFLIYFMPKILVYDNFLFSFQKNSLIYIPIVGLLVGIVCLILNITEEEKIDSRKLFMTSLGIPLLLISIVTSFTDKLQSNKKIEELKSRASVQETTVPDAPIEEVKIKEVVISFDTLTEKQSGIFNIKNLYAQVSRQITPGYYIIISSLKDEEAANERFLKYREYSFNTNKYYNIVLQLLKDNNSNFYITISDAIGSADEAKRMLRLFEINDIEFISGYKLSPKIVKVN